MYGETGLPHVLEVGGSHAHPLDQGLACEDFSQALSPDDKNKLQALPAFQDASFIDSQPSDECGGNRGDIQGM